jgi:hypothetical protein
MFYKKTYPENELLSEYFCFLRSYQCLSEATIWNWWTGPDVCSETINAGQYQKTCHPYWCN